MSGENDCVRLASSYYITENGSHLFNQDTNKWTTPKSNVKEGHKVEDKWSSEYTYYNIAFLESDRIQKNSNIVVHRLEANGFLKLPEELLATGLYIVPDHLDRKKKTFGGI